MTRQAFRDWVAARNAAGLYLCVGLDPDDKFIPPRVGLRNWLIDTIDATAPHAACFKPNAAFYEWRKRMRPEGVTGQEVLAKIVGYIHERYCDVLVIGDGKRADIGNTNIPYAMEFFDWFGCDALTTNPYLGGGALSPFFEREGRGVIVICRTSNPEGEEFQSRLVEVDPPILGQTMAPLYQLVAYRAASFWNERGNCGLVVGATAPEEAEKISQIAPELVKLVPGIGYQGGRISDAVRGVYVPSGVAIYNVSRGIDAAWQTDKFGTDPQDFAQAAANAARYYSETLAGVYEELRRAP